MCRECASDKCKEVPLGIIVKAKLIRFTVIEVEEDRVEGLSDELNVGKI
jgi:hypothetical protein